MLRWLFVLAFLPTLALASPIGNISDVKIKAPPAKVEAQCRDYKPSKAQVQAFFKRAILITPRQEHDYFLYGPCTAEGSFKTRYGHWEWKMRNGGTAYVEDVMGNLYIFADPSKNRAWTNKPFPQSNHPLFTGRLHVLRPVCRA